MWLHLPWNATRTYHPGADVNRRASKAGSAFDSFMIAPWDCPRAEPLAR
jgi:hypothetical protein